MGVAAHGKAGVERIGSWAMIAVGAACLFGASGMRIGSLSEPGAGFWPLCVSAVMIASAAVSLRRGRERAALEQNNAEGGLMARGSQGHETPEHRARERNMQNGGERAYNGLRSDRQEGVRPAIGDSLTWKRAAYVSLGIASIGLFNLMFEWLGMTLSSFLLLLFWIRALGHERWRISLFASAGFTVFSVVVFVWGINVPFPPDLILTYVTGKP